MLHVLQPESRPGPAWGKVHVQPVQEALGRVGMKGNGVADGVVVAAHPSQGAKVVRLAAGEEHDLVEQVEGRGGGLVDARDDDEPEPGGDPTQVADDLVTGRRVQPAGRLVQEEDPRAGHELAGDADPPLLAPAEAPPDRGADDRVGLAAQAERVEEALDPGRALPPGGHRAAAAAAAAARQPQREPQRLPRRQRADERVFLFHEGAEPPKRRPRGRRPVDEDPSVDPGGLRGAGGQRVQERRLAAARRAHQGQDLACGK